jgi:anti-sigma-K factor RskA
MNTHVDQEDLGLYATGAVEAGEMDRIRLHVDTCVECRNELQRIYGDLGFLGMSAPEAAPSAALRRRLMESIAKEQVGEKVVEIPRRGFQWGWIAVAAALLMAVLGGIQWNSNRQLKADLAEANRNAAALQAKSDAALKIAATLSAPDALRLTLVKAGEKPQPQLQTIYSASQGRVVLVANNLEPLPPGKGYELWVLPVEGNPVAAGVFHPDAKGHANHTYEFKNAVAGKGFAITVENDEGAEAPTSKPIFVGLKD